MLEKEYINYSLNKLRSHGVIIVPTDTYYGISCDAFDSIAVDKIFKIKRREKNQLLPVLISDKTKSFDKLWFITTISGFFTGIGLILVNIELDNCE